MKTYRSEDLEWCSGRMAHLRVKGEYRTLCGADLRGTPASLVGEPEWDAFLAPGGLGHRPTLTDAEAAEKHKCKNCLKRVKEEE